ncbi:winged helix-turn-helix domain-containing protein [Photorhabdus akhurstii]|uniref:helix-turn-helix domain-containing protein n=1 Tax=Photorhabdus akhurstii TaxID=171438 RepID=UPI003704696A
MANFMHTTQQIIAYIWARWQVVFTVAGVTKWLQRLGFSYKKPMGKRHKFDMDKQQQFIESYTVLKAACGRNHRQPYPPQHHGRTQFATD